MLIILATIPDAVAEGKNDKANGTATVYGNNKATNGTGKDTSATDGNDKATNRTGKGTSTTSKKDPCEDLDLSENSTRFSMLGLCSNSKTGLRMSRKCKRSCGIDVGKTKCCMDLETDCSSANCSSAVQRVKCLATCTRCNCKDTAKDCTSYKAYCHGDKYSKLMRTRCRRTCNFC
ncbi:unnamed protein product [Gongylonema pulchrum]|uniref:ShKT domain-containing protein n=1 Tax=Gongylonema pulchrum TaxID=637853 RepID=A0A183DAN3_9BILA|nr:unnamed protein product [Gongylonema pulchrum]